MEESSLIFFVFLITTLTTCFSVAIRKILKMKCSSIKCCGLEVIRDVELETRANTSSSERPLGPSLI